MLIMSKPDRVMLAMKSLWNEVNRLREYRSRDDISDIETDETGTVRFSVRYLGDWEVPADEEDDGDYDWKVPTAATARRLDALVVKYNVNGVSVTWSNDGEKCWLSFFGTGQGK